MSNGGYLQSEDAQKARTQLLEDLNRQFDEIIEGIINPEPEVDLSANPFFAQGQAGLDRLRWNYKQGVTEEL